MATPAQPTTSPAQRIVEQLRDRLEEHKASKDAFVVSVYGEWGVGKTHCLRQILEQFQSALDADIATAIDGKPLSRLVVPLLFDPWQYEHEDHLVIPLLKTIEMALTRVASKAEEDARGRAPTGDPFVQRAQALGRSLKQAGTVFAEVASALLSGFRFKLAPLKEITGLEIDFSPKDVIDAGRKIPERLTAARPGAAQPPWYQRLWPAKPQDETHAALAQAHERLAKRESMYFDVQRVLRELTQGHQPPLRLVVLIDDLDRCLPEKAIQVLESVKLFLNVRGFSFVLAVDDEVVERGIAHRYAAYIVDRRPGGAASAPITGAEYLEKIVHLPVHLQRWTRVEAARFLRDSYGELFGALPADGDALAGASDLLNLVLDGVPLVPRKLIRLAEALDFQRVHFAKLQASALWRPTHAARVVALQQLYPGLYRHLRLSAGRYWRMFEFKRNPFGEPATLGTSPVSLSRLRRDYEARADGKEDTGTATEANSLRERLDMLQLINDAGQQRGSPDPLALFRHDAPETERDAKHIHARMGYEEFSQLYLHGLAWAPPPETAAPTATAATQSVAAVVDEAALFERLLQSDKVSRREYLQSLALQGHLPDRVFENLLARLDGQDELMRDIDWLRDIDTLLSREQLLALYQRHRVVERLGSAT